MYRPRPITALATVALLVGGLAWLSSHSDLGFETVKELDPGVAYAIHCPAAGTGFDLDFQPDTRYWLVVSSLGDSGTKHDVTLEAEPSLSAPVLPARPLGEFRHRRSADRNGAEHQADSDSGWASSSLWGLAERYLAASRHGRISSIMPPDRQQSHALQSRARPGARSQRSLNAFRTDRQFFLHVRDGSLDDPQNYARVVGRLIAKGRDVRLYLDRQQAPDDLAEGVIDEIVRLVDEEILPRSRARLGEYCDVDGDGTFTILMSPWLDHLQGGRTSVGGFVRGNDFQRHVEPPFSNHCDMLYLNSNVRPGPHLHTLLAHEMTHAICISQRLRSQAAGTRRSIHEEDWLNEAVAHVAENVHQSGWSNLDYRISRYLNDPSRYPLVVSDYYRSGLWRDHGCRGAAYLFLRWCADQFDENLLKRLIRGPHQGRRNLEQATGVSFEELFRRWTLALLTSGRSEETSGQAGQYRSVDLRGRIAGWGLAGPRIRYWDVDAGQRTVSLGGTAASFWELQASGSPGTRRIHIRCRTESPLQVSVIKQPADWPRVRLQTTGIEFVSDGRTSGTTDPPVTPAAAGGQTSGDSSHAPAALRLRIVGQADGEMQVETIACERHNGELRESFCFYGDTLRPRKVAGGAAPTGCDVTYLLPITMPNGSTGEVVIKVVCSDGQGSRATAWRIGETAAAGHRPKIDASRLEMARLLKGDG